MLTTKPLLTAAATIALSVLVVSAPVRGDTPPAESATIEKMPRSKPRGEMAPESTDALRKAWEADSKPRVQLVVCYDRDGKVEDGNTPLAQSLRAAIARELRRGIGTIVDADLLSFQRLGDVKSIANQRGGDLAKTVASLMRDACDSDLIVWVRLSPKPGGTTGVVLQVSDPAIAEERASQAYEDLSANPSLDEIKLYAATIGKNFAEQYLAAMTRDGGPQYSVRVRILGVDGAQADDLKELMQGFRGVSGMIRHEALTGEGGVGYAEFYVPYGSADTAPLRVALRNAVKANMDGEAFRDSRYGRGSVIGSILPVRVPRWYAATDLEDPAGEQHATDAQKKRETAKSMARRLKAAVVIGPELGSPAAVIENPNQAIKVEFDDDTLQAELEAWMTRLGFDAVDHSALAETKRRAQAQAARFENLANLADALDDKKSFEFLLYGNLQSGGNGKSYVFRLIDRQNGAVLATQVWPDAKNFDEDTKFHVKASEAASVARYVAGNLVSRADTRLNDHRQVCDVIVKNIDDEKKLVAIAKIFEQGKTVRSVGTYHFSMPEGGFEIVYEGSRDSLMDAMSSGLGKLGWPAMLDAFDDTQIVLNLHRVAIVAKKPEEVKKEVQAAVASPAGKTIQQQLQMVRDSVCVVGLKDEAGKFTPLGTAWTVAPNTLATNAHVAAFLTDAYLAQAGNGHKLQAVGLRGPSHSIELALRRPRIHPGYERWSSFLQQFKEGEMQAIPIFDVALVEVGSGDAGKPLTLADAKDLELILPGDPVGYAGFPMENKQNYASLPTMIQDIGTVSAYTDGFFQAVDARQCVLIQHNLTLLGGASGSPMINGTGRVVGLCSAGDTIKPDSIPYPPARPMRVVLNEDKTPRIDSQSRMAEIAILDQDGIPVRLAQQKQVVVVPFATQGNGTPDVRPLDPQREKVVTVSLSEVMINSSTMEVVAVMHEQDRIPIGFRYSQRVDMLRELLDGTADKNLPDHEREWSATLAKLRSK